MQAQQNLEAALKFAEVIAGWVGFNVFVADYRLKPISFLVIFDAVTYIFMTLYNVYEFRDDINRVCFCLITWTFGFQGIARIVVFVSRRNDLIELRDITLDVTIRTQRASATQSLSMEYARYSYIFVRFFCYSFFLCGILALLVPVYPIFVLDKLVLPFGFVIPGVSDTTHPGFEINYVHHIIQVYFTCSGIVCSLAFTVMYVLNVCLQIDVITVKLRQLSFNLVLAEPSSGLQDVDFGEIIKLHQQVLNFVFQLEKLFCMQYLLDAICIELQVIFCLYVLLANFWLPGAAIIINVMGILCIDCLIGHIVEIKFDRICYEIYQIPWYMIKPKHRPALAFMLQRSQSTKLLTFGKMKPMNMATFVQILKSIYSFFMFLQNTV